MLADLDRQYIRTTAMIAAAEDWGDEYAKDPKTHAKLMKLEAKWQLALSRLFNDLGAQAGQFINLGAYYSQITADYNVEVIIQDKPFEDAANTFIKVSLETVTLITVAGAEAGEVIYNIPLGISSTSEAIQALSTKHVASLVGKKVLPDGSVIDNPKAEYNITRTMRKDIAQSIKTSLALGENVQDATERIRKVIADPKRAEMIAKTESVNAYQSGLAEFAKQSGAVGKEWQTAGAIDVCADYAALGPQPADYLYGGRVLKPTAHVRCRCGIRWIYPPEWKALGYS